MVNMFRIILFLIMKVIFYQPTPQMEQTMFLISQVNSGKFSDIIWILTLNTYKV